MKKGRKGFQLYSKERKTQIQKGEKSLLYDRKKEIGGRRGTLGEARSESLGKPRSHGIPKSSLFGVPSIKLGKSGKAWGEM